MSAAMTRTTIVDTTTNVISLSAQSGFIQWSYIAFCKLHKHTAQGTGAPEFQGVVIVAFFRRFCCLAWSTSNSNSNCNRNGRSEEITSRSWQLDSSGWRGESSDGFGRWKETVQTWRAAADSSKHGLQRLADQPAICTAEHTLWRVPILVLIGETICGFGCRVLTARSTTIRKSIDKAGTSHDMVRRRRGPKKDGFKYFEHSLANQSVVSCKTLSCRRSSNSWTGNEAFSLLVVVYTSFVYSFGLYYFLYHFSECIQYLA